jgi:hypothetical protein
MESPEADNAGPITGRAGTERRSTDKNYTAGPVRRIGGLSATLAVPAPRAFVGN